MTQLPVLNFAQLLAAHGAPLMPAQLTALMAALQNYNDSSSGTAVRIGSSCDSVSCCLFITRLLVCSFTLSLVHLFICSFVHLFICSFVHLFICSFVHLFICSLIYLFTFCINLLILTFQ